MINYMILYILNWSVTLTDNLYINMYYQTRIDVTIADQQVHLHLP